ncbi:hypothetical protein TRFO_25618 [Tritrichomonas foetus]|uniref:Cyclin, N-terminal domain containing protein n=1 Tax=Tritrichomonas foetus TaxID=1144522 RepID=A0A1J4KA16_9EUKA|nr:hypothetical protein TRFO_25618 [Tritrichomonas foetus]|eukprot:OHT06293.1 hypothetical protein TRFO_25618 [Tritrichomonas foetus]
MIMTNQQTLLGLKKCKAATTAYTLMHKYFYNISLGNYSRHKIYIILASSMFLGGKLEDEFHSLNDIFTAIGRVIEMAEGKIKKFSVREVLEVDASETFELTMTQIKILCDCEVQLLMANNWSMEVDSPYKYMRCEFFGTDIAKRVSLCQNVTVYVSAIIQSKKYLNIPLPIAAAAAIHLTFESYKIKAPSDVLEWLEAQKSSNEEAFKYCVSIATKFYQCCLNSYLADKMM